MKSSVNRVLTRMHLRRILDKKEGGGGGDGDKPPIQTSGDADIDAEGQRQDRKRAASGEPDDASRSDEQTTSGSSRKVLPPPAPPGAKMQDPGHSPETAARNKRHLESLRAQAQAQAHRRAQADRRGAKRGMDESVHPEDPRATNPDEPEMSLVGSYGTRCGCCEQTFESRSLLFQPLRDEQHAIVSDDEPISELNNVSREAASHPPDEAGGS